MQSPSTDEIVQCLLEWRQVHPQVTFDEIDEEVAHQFAGLQAQIVATLSQTAPRDAGAGEPRAGAGDQLLCPQCQTALQRRSQRRRRVPSRQGQEVVLQRA